MIVAVLALALASFGDQQVLAGSAFERFVAAADAICPERRARNITPADLDWVQEDFLATLPPSQRAHVAALDEADVRCAGRDGLSCPTTATLEALARAQLTPRFAAFACRTALPH